MWTSICYFLLSRVIVPWGKSNLRHQDIQQSNKLVIINDLAVAGALTGGAATAEPFGALPCILPRVLRIKLSAAGENYAPPRA